MPLLSLSNSSVRLLPRETPGLTDSRRFFPRSEVFRWKRKREYPTADKLGTRQRNLKPNLPSATVPPNAPLGCQEPDQMYAPSWLSGLRTA